MASILSISSSTGRFHNNTIPDEEPVPSRSQVDSIAALQQNVQAEQQDERIEGLEATMAKMKRTIKVQHLIYAK